MGDEVETPEPFHAELAKDGGAQSRKLWLILAAMVMVVVSGCIAAAWMRFGPHLGPVIDGIVMLAGIYCGANVGAKLTAALASRKPPEQS